MYCERNTFSVQNSVAENQRPNTCSKRYHYLLYSPEVMFSATSNNYVVMYLKKMTEALQYGLYFID